MTRLSSNAINQLALLDLQPLLNRVELSALFNSRIFTTGCTGFMGYWLLLAIESMNSKGANIRVFALSRNVNSFFEKHPDFKAFTWLTLVEGDIKDFLFEEQLFDYIIHGATDTRPELLDNPLELIKAMQTGTFRICEQARISGVKAMLLLSSGAVYQHAYKVDSPGVLPYLDGYCLAKQLMEKIVVEQAEKFGFQAKIARGFAFVGYLLPEHLAAADIINACLTKHTIHLNSDGAAVRSYLYAADMAVWLLRILIAGNNMQAYDVGSDHASTILNHAHLFRDIIAPDKQVMAEKITSNYRNDYVPNVGLTKQHLQLDVWTSLPEAVTKTAHMQSLL